MKTAKLLIVQAALLAALAAPPAAADGREAMRLRLDSLAVETQVRKRMGQPIDELEAASAALRDSIVGMRSSSPYADPGQGGEASALGRFFAPVGSAVSSFLESTVSFKPAGLFDWVIVGTGVVAVLSGLLLLIGIAAGRRRKPASKKSAAAAPFKKIDHAAPAAEPPPLFPDAKKPAAAPTYNAKGLAEIAAQMPPPPVPPAMENLLGTLRAAAQQQQSQAQPQSQPQPLPPPPTPVPPAPPTPPPLFANAPDSPAPPRARGANVPKIGTREFGASIAEDAESGMSDIEISRRYKISVDQVRLMLKMKSD